MALLSRINTNTKNNPPPLRGNPALHARPLLASLVPPAPTVKDQHHGNSHFVRAARSTAPRLVPFLSPFVGLGRPPGRPDPGSLRRGPPLSLTANIPQAAERVQVQAGKRMAAINTAGTVTERGTVQVQMGTLSNGEVGPLLSSLNRGGTPKTASEARDDDLVDIGGHSTTVANAVRLGFLTRDKATGSLLDNTPALAAAEAEKGAAEKAAAEAMENDPHYGKPLAGGATEALRELVSTTTAGS